MFQFVRNLGKFVGPGYMIAVGYLDPGNWATDLAAGSEFSYSLLFVIFLSNILAITLQFLAIKLGAVTQLDLAQACRKRLHPKVNIVFYILCELAIVACDLAEVIGSAIALKLLFGIPIWIGTVLTSLDVLLILTGWKSKRIHIFELLFLLLFFGIGACFAILLYHTKPDWNLVLKGFIPTTQVLTNFRAIYLAMGIIGATVMPHNLYLHSNIVKNRTCRNAEFGELCLAEELDEDYEQLSPFMNDQGTYTPELLKKAIQFSNYDSILALCLALIINSSILVVAATSFDGSDSGDLFKTHGTLVENFGKLAGLAFAVALLLSGQSSTITGTLAGQICMQGFLGNTFFVRKSVRRIITRSLAVVPATLVALYGGESAISELLLLSQVILSLQLPFAIWPLVIFTNSKELMAVSFAAHRREEDEPSLDLVQQDFSNGPVLKIASYMIAAIITIFNLILLFQAYQGS